MTIEAKRKMVIPAQAGIQAGIASWIPAFAGMTAKRTMGIPASAGIQVGIACLDSGVRRNDGA